MKKSLICALVGAWSLATAQAQEVNYNLLKPTTGQQIINFDAGQGYKHRILNNVPLGSTSRLTFQVQNPSLSGFKDAMTITSDGIVGINTTFPTVITTPSAVNPSDFLEYKLYVKGGIKAEKVRVELSATAGWGDFVFEPAYRLMPLTELQRYISQHKHLPAIPSADQIKKEGIDVGEMQRLQMVKIEELTLYILELKKENEQMRTRLEKLENNEKR